MTVVFSTYQSIEVISRAQSKMLSHTNNEYGIFDIIICDEAHRTTGVTLKGTDESAFIKVHDNNFIKAKHRIYMTATPRLYTSEARKKQKKMMQFSVLWMMSPCMEKRFIVSALVKL